MNNIKMLDARECTGCRACESLCPTHCISIKPDQYGFLYPTVDETKCIKCGICFNSCKLIHKKPIESSYVQSVYAVKNKNLSICKTSSSGGVFFTIAEMILEQGGFVYGCMFDDMTAIHVEVTKKEELYKLQGSKYVQSDTQNTYRLVKNRLQMSKKVLYVGTACQIQGLKVFLGKNYSNLFLVDIICHGVPSPLLFKKYIAWLEEKYHGKVSNYQFRSKDRGWGLTSQFIVNGKSKYRDAYLDPYYNSFLNQMTYRECCYKCNFATRERVSDLTLGDFWGVEKFYPEFTSEYGVSVLLVNTKKGEDLFDLVKNQFNIMKATFEQASCKNSNLVRSSYRPEIRSKIYDELLKHNFDDITRLYLLPGHHIGRKIKVLIPFKIKKKIKSIKNIFY